MYHSVEHIEKIFTTVNPTYWIIREKDKNGTVKFTSEHGTFADCLELLPHGIYNISMRKGANATKDAPNYTFQYGDAVQGVGNTATKADAVLMGGSNWGGTSMMGMMMMMYQESQKTNQALLMQLNQTHIQGVQTTHAKDMELFKLQMSMNQNKSTADKLLGVLVSPNMPKILEAVSGMVNGQPVAIGRLTTEGAVPAPVHNADNTQAAETEADAPQAFDLNALTPQQRAVYDRGVRINAIMAKIQAKFPDGDPVDQMETAADVILSMPEDKLNALMVESFTQSIGL